MRCEPSNTDLQGQLAPLQLGLTGTIVGASFFRVEPQRLHRGCCKSATALGHDTLADLCFPIYCRYVR